MLFVADAPFHRWHPSLNTANQEEIARLGNMHTMLRTVFDNRLIFPPVVRPQRILECGFGAAHWAVDVAEHYPDAEVRA